MKKFGDLYFTKESADSWPKAYLKLKNGFVVSVIDERKSVQRGYKNWHYTVSAKYKHNNLEIRTGPAIAKTPKAVSKMMKFIQRIQIKQEIDKS